MSLMKTDELQKFIQNLSPDLYSFAYILIPDDLQASQLMIDCVQSFIIQKRPMIERMTLTKNKMVRNLLDETKSHLFQILCELAKKRYQQLKMSFSVVEQSGGFFALEFDEKAVLYLKDKVAMDLEQIEFITGLTRAELLAKLYSARIKMTEIMPNQQLFNEAGNDVRGGVA
jgi:predicted DNA-binding protein (UPF0251 family)